MANLENDEKTIIQEGEIYRSEVPEEIASQSSKKWYVLVGKMFNTPLMAAIVIVTFGMAADLELLRIADDRKTELELRKTELEVGKAQQENLLATEKLKAEIDYRATQIKEYLKM